MRPLHKICLLATTLLGVAGCATYTVNSDYDADFDFSALKTFNWTSDSQPETGEPRIDNPLLNSKVRSAVNQTLASKGYEKVTSDAADFLVQYHIAIEEKSDIMTVDTAYPAAGPTAMPGGFNAIGYSAGYRRAESYVVNYEEGTLLIDIVDPKSEQLIWRGSVQKVVEPSTSPEKKNANINKAVQKALKAFPPQ